MIKQELYMPPELPNYLIGLYMDKKYEVVQYIFSKMSIEDKQTVLQVASVKPEKHTLQYFIDIMCI